jgi:hypothetical protein
MINYISRLYRTNGCNAPYGYDTELDKLVCLGCKEPMNKLYHQYVNGDGRTTFVHPQISKDDWDDLFDIMQP